MHKIHFTKLLNEKGGLSLIEAKEIKDRIVNNNEVIEIIISNIQVAKIIVIEAKKLGVNCEFEE